LKPYYESQGITIYHGDCREILTTLPKADLVLTDPPYGIDFDTDYRRFTHNARVKPGTNYPRVAGDRLLPAISRSNKILKTAA
jgi:DNA modification methylase